jgi:predicted transcriptional regulator
MDHTNETEEQILLPAEKSKKSHGTTDNFTSDMRFIVTRNKRNAWMDEMYETPPDYADLPIFN